MANNDESALLLALTTEHFTLQTARSATITESNGRVSLFLGFVSSAVVAIAIVGQLSGFSKPFFVFALTLLPALVFLGLATYVRVLQNGIEDLQYARAINRIRQHYVELFSDAGSFALSTDETQAGSMHDVISERWQPLFTTAGMVAFVISVLVGVTIALAVGAAVGLPIIGSAGIGITSSLTAAWPSSVTNVPGGAERAGFKRSRGRTCLR